MQSWIVHMNRGKSSHESRMKRGERYLLNKSTFRYNTSESVIPGPCCELSTTRWIVVAE